MNQEAINLTKVAIKHYEDEKLRLTAKILSCRIKIEQAENDIFRVDNIKHSLDAALEKLEEADEKEGRERDPAREEITKENKEALSELEDPPEQTGEEKDQETIDKADKLIKRETEKWKTIKKDWKKCSRCNRRPVAPWNKKGICSTCQTRKKTNRPYKRRDVII